MNTGPLRLSVCLLFTLSSFLSLSLHHQKPQLCTQEEYRLWTHSKDLAYDNPAVH